MVRERVRNKNFHAAYLIAAPEADIPLRPELFFTTGRPIELDLGCGRGRFLLARARGCPDTNFIGVDRSLLRLHKIDRKAQAEGLTNIRLINADARRILASLPAASVACLYLFFPDPWPKRRHYPLRLVSPLFLDLVFKVLRPGGSMHLCTDHDDYFAWMLKHCRPDPRFTEIAPFIPTEEEETDFGLIFRKQNRPTNRCSFKTAGR